MTFAMQIGRVVAPFMLAGVLFSTLTGCSSHSGEPKAVPGSAKADQLKAQGKQCIRPKEEMRRNHMEIIKHQRDITVHQGVRSTTDSLAGCIACHVKYNKNGEPIPVNAPGQKCHGCHEYLAVAPTCFGCHSTVPGGPQPANLHEQWPDVFAAPSKTSAPHQVHATHHAPAHEQHSEAKAPATKPEAETTPVEPVKSEATASDHSTKVEVSKPAPTVADSAPTALEKSEPIPVEPPGSETSDEASAEPAKADPAPAIDSTPTEQPAPPASTEPTAPDGGH